MFVEGGEGREEKVMFAEGGEGREGKDDLCRKKRKI